MPTHSTYSSSVDVATGAVLSYGFDFYLNGVIPFEIERLWFSDSDFSGRLGYGVHSIFDVQFKIDEESIGLLTKEVWRTGLTWHFVYDGKEMGARCVHTWGDKDLYNHRLNFLDGKTIKRWARVKENYNRRAAPVFG